jgi:hypothetical protein
MNSWPSKRLRSRLTPVLSSSHQAADPADYF